MAKVPGAGIIADPDASYLIWRSIMTGASDEQEAQLSRAWKRYSEKSLADGEKVKNAMRKEVANIREWAKDNKGFIKTGSRALAPFERKAEQSLAWWIDREYTRLEIFPTKSKPKSIAVFNKTYNKDRGGVTKIIDPSAELGRSSIEEANKRLKIVPQDKLEDIFDRNEENIERHRESWIDNVVRAIEQARHQSRTVFTIDAFSSPEPVSAIANAVEKFYIPMQIIELSFKTHARAAFRSAMATGASALKTDQFMYYLPPDARADASPTGFGADHFARIESARTWEAIRRGLGHKRPGSFIFSTGFHVGDKGALIPVPKQLLESARQFERRERQRFLERKRNG